MSTPRALRKFKVTDIRNDMNVLSVLKLANSKSFAEVEGLGRTRPGNDVV